jgi:two-component system, NtrC family, response regulator HydG
VILEESLDDMKRRLLMNALEKAKGNRSEAARMLGISRTSVWKQIKRYKLG